MNDMIDNETSEYMLNEYGKFYQRLCSVSDGEKLESVEVVAEKIKTLLKVTDGSWDAVDSLDCLSILYQRLASVSNRLHPSTHGFHFELIDFLKKYILGVVK